MIQNQTSQRKKFTAEEDAALKQLVGQSAVVDWNNIAMCIPGRTARQCRTRYKNYLAPGIFNGEWTSEEDDLLLIKFREMGPKWETMKQFFPSRSGNALKNRWNYYVSYRTTNVGNVDKDQNKKIAFPEITPLPPITSLIPSFISKSGNYLPMYQFC